MNRGNNNNNDDPNVGAVVATVAIGAAAVYGAFKLFGSMFDSNEPGQSNSVRIQGRPHQQLSLDSSMDRPQIYSFRRNQEIHLVNTVKECRYSMRELKSHCAGNENFLGFDCEWVSEYRKDGRRKVALLQLATHRGLCILIRLSKLQYIPSELEEILENSDIIKIGVAPYTDAKYLRDDYQVHVASTIDLRFVAETAGCRSGKLSKMSEDYLGISLDKSSSDSVQCSDWEAETLSSEQIEYAAEDVRVAVELFKYFGGKIAPESSSRYIVTNYLSKYINKNYGPPKNVPSGWSQLQYY